MIRITICTALVLILVLITGTCIDGDETGQNTRQEDEIMLPEPRTTGEISIEEAMRNRRSVRQYTEEAITLNNLSQLLWAAQGITSEEGFRTTPSAGALYPLEVYVVAGDVDGLSDGVYRYRAEGHTLQRIRDGDLRGNLSECALKQTQVTDAAANIVFAAVFNRTTAKYGERGAQYVHIEAGHAAQNVYLQAEALGIGVCAVGAFYGQEVSELLALSGDETPIYILTVGKV
ncbi:MAG: nitroreductase [Candidatus Methanogaster sp.]|uniref:Nitroreductase n=1 Tax=Candidatus Methanogaster sp. TaxID=3386292 RepID=A0AC61KZM8_9EURY|nr:MAG: nitroreductase [ANME-2 cluster archaeon]